MNNGIYLMLDKDTLEECGTVTRKRVLTDGGLTPSQFYNLLLSGKPYKGKYILVEESFGDDSPRDEDEEMYKLICELDESHGKNRGNCYYVTSKGRFVRKTRKGREMELKVWKHHTKFSIRIGMKEATATRIYAKAFLGMKDNEECRLPGDKWDISKITIGTPKQIRGDTATLNSRCIKVGLFENGKCIKKFSSIAECGRYLGYHKETVRCMLNGTILKPQYDIRRI